ncbi:MAG: hypothetical protein AAB403_24760 [Planctomycetota bacterium]
MFGAEVVSPFSDEKLPLLRVELTTAMLSTRIIYMMICVQMRVNPSTLWILSVIEWHTDEMMTAIRRLKRQVGQK